MDREDFQTVADALADQCIASRMRVLSRFVTGIYDEALRPLGLKVTQLTVLVTIARMGEAKPAALSEMLYMDASTLSRNVDRMRRRGWIAANPGRDGRTMMLRLTDSGKDLLLRAIAAWQTAQVQAAGQLGPKGVSMLYELTRSLGHAEQDS